MYAHVLVCAGCLFSIDCAHSHVLLVWFFFIATHRLKFNGAIIKWNSLLHVIMLTIAINRYTLIWATATAATLITKPNWTSSRFFMNKNVRSFNDAASTHIVLLINVINKYKFAQRRGSHNQFRTNARTYQYMNVFRSIPCKNDPVFTANENICYVSNTRTNTLRTMHLLCLIMIIIMHVHLYRELISSFYAV